MFVEDTIVAPATPPGRGSVGIIRVSGANAKNIARTLTQRELLPRLASYGPFYQQDGSVLDQGIALLFESPLSFTGEDVLELQGHGGPVIMDLLLKTCLAEGARMAMPGEFSQRAFLNNKIDLLQAEAIADLIDSQSKEAALASLQTLQGEFSKKIETLVDKTIELRMFVEAAIDFPDEEIDFLSESHLEASLLRLNESLLELRAQAHSGALLKEGVQLVIGGEPNTGKSTLINQLSGQEIALVTDIPGTTRDVMRQSVVLAGLTFHLSDTAGIRNTDDKVEKLGIAKAKQTIAHAQHVLWLLSANEKPADAIKKIKSLLTLSSLPKITLVHNKIDLENIQPYASIDDGYSLLGISAKSGQGMDELMQHLIKSHGYAANMEGQFMARRRHLQALEKAQSSVAQALDQLKIYRAGELVAEELRQAQLALSEITGEFTTDDLLGKIFSQFCIGK